MPQRKYEITEYDLYLFNEGKHYNIYDKLGAHLTEEAGVPGVHFAVWSPGAAAVNVVGDFNAWDGNRHRMKEHAKSGVFSLFIPGIKKGSLYQYQIITAKNEVLMKSDPYAFFSQIRPGNASIICDLDEYIWHDKDWIDRRNESSPMSIYEVHAGSWMRIKDDLHPQEADGGGGFANYRELADRLIPYVKKSGFTHIEFLPLTEHPHDGSWGYQVTGYFSVTSRYGTPEDFMYLVDQCHSEGIGVIIDWVPGHFPKDACGLANFNGRPLYEYTDSLRANHPQWGTLIFDYRRNEVRNFLISSALFWLEKYHVDGLRVDAVSSMLYLDFGREPGQWLPNKWGGRENMDAILFIKQLNRTINKYFPGTIMAAEESTSWLKVTDRIYAGGLGFSHKWNLGWMNDILRYMSMDPIYRKYNHNLLTFSLMYAFDENFTLPFSHDEVVHGKKSLLNKMPGDYQQKFASLRLLYGYMFGHPGSKLIFMGSEFGEFIEWDFRKGLDWDLLDSEMHRKLSNWVTDLNNMYRNEKALYELDSLQLGFEWLDCNDADHGVVSFLRKSNEYYTTTSKNINTIKKAVAKCASGFLIFVCNFTPVLYNDYRIGVPAKCNYSELLNSDSYYYGGSNTGNMSRIEAEAAPHLKHLYSIKMTIPPLSTIILKPDLSGS